MPGGNPTLGADGGDIFAETISISGDDVVLASGGAMNLFARIRGAGAGSKEVGYAGGQALLELTPHRTAVCHLVQVCASPGAQEEGPLAGLPFPFESVAHHNCLGLFFFSLTQVRRWRACITEEAALVLYVTCVRSAHCCHSCSLWFLYTETPIVDGDCAQSSMLLRILGSLSMLEQIGRTI
jgi:hypothetical protein